MIPQGPTTTLRHIGQKVLKIGKSTAKISTNHLLGKKDNSFLLNDIVSLGPVYIKVGQLLSTRSDVIGEDLASALRPLQDKVPKTQGCFELVPDGIDIDSEPIAAASLGQVYLGKIKESNETVAVKLKRLDTVEYLTIDKFIVDSLIWVLSVVHKQAAKDIEVTMEEFFSNLEMELDYKREVDNMIEMKTKLSEFEWLVVPEIHNELCNNDTIVMEYIPSVKIDEVEKLKEMDIDTAALSMSLIDCFMKQFIDYSMFHADPHPGNIGITIDGKVVIYDFGMVCNIPQKLKDRSDELLRALLLDNPEHLGQTLLDCDVLRLTPECKNGPEDLIPFMKLFIEYMKTGNFDIEKAKTSFENMDTSPFILNPSLIMLGRAFGLLEGVCIKLDPDFNLEKAARFHLDERKQDALELANNNIKKFAEMTARIPDTIDRMHRVQKEQQKEIYVLRNQLSESNKTVKRLYMFLIPLIALTGLIKP